MSGAVDGGVRRLTPRLPGDPVVWIATTHDDPTRSPDERRRARRLLLDRLVADELPGGEVRRSSGRPVVDTDTGRWWASASSSGTTCAAAVARLPVGVDVEELTAFPEALDVASTFFTDREQRYVSTGDVRAVVARVLDVWTLKEAVAKCTGLGMAGLDPTTYDVEPRASEGSVPALGVRTSSLRLRGGGPIVAVAVAVDGAVDAAVDAAWTVGGMIGT